MLRIKRNMAMCNTANVTTANSHTRKRMLQHMYNYTASYVNAISQYVYIYIFWWRLECRFFVGLFQPRDRILCGVQWYEGRDLWCGCCLFLCLRYGEKYCQIRQRFGSQQKQGVGMFCSV